MARHEGVAVQRDAVDLDALARRVVAKAKGQVGAVTTFAGYVRADSLGKGKVTSIDYEAFREMALEQLARIRRDAMAKFGLADCRIVHRTGTLKVGQPSIFVLCAAGHRAPTLEATAWIMDEVKRVVPVWKRERSKDGERWVEGHDHGRRQGHATAPRLPEARLPFG